MPRHCNHYLQGPGIVEQFINLIPNSMLYNWLLYILVLSSAIFYSDEHLSIVPTYGANTSICFYILVILWVTMEHPGTIDQQLFTTVIAD